MHDFSNSINYFTESYYFFFKFQNKVYKDRGKWASSLDKLGL